MTDPEPSDINDFERLRKWLELASMAMSLQERSVSMDLEAKERTTSRRLAVLRVVVWMAVRVAAFLISVHFLSTIF